MESVQAKTTVQHSRLMVGLMSGTSLDGVDAALARVSGSGREMEVDLLGFHTVSYSAAMRALLLKNSQPDTSSVAEICQLNVRLSHVYAEAVEQLLRESEYTTASLDAIGCHGQTIYHVPDATDCAGALTRSTLQIGDPSTLAKLLETIVVGDFRLADMAFGGQGAPLVPYFDHVFFSHPEEHRILLNIGGIGNLSLLKAGADATHIEAFDTGPGNMVSDALVQHFWDEPYDEGGRHALQGKVNPALLTTLLNDDYYARKPPKSTGRELYDAAYVNRVLDRAKKEGMERPEDIIATAAQLTVETITNAINAFVSPYTAIDRVIASGGGVHNVFIMQGLKERLAPVKIEAMGALGLDSDAKEAVCFAVLAHETLNGMPSNVPSATGADRPAILGKICLPG